LQNAAPAGRTDIAKCASPLDRPGLFPRLGLQVTAYGSRVLGWHAGCLS
jgi:hypothetical protein